MNYKHVAVWITKDSKSGYKWKYDESQMHVNFIFCKIDNLIDLGSEPKDIIIITNFDLTYRNVKTYRVNDSEIQLQSAFANKMPLTANLIKSGIIDGNFIFEDMDAFKCRDFLFPDIKTFAFTKHDPNRRKCQGGVSYWSKNSLDTFIKIAEDIKKSNIRKEENFLPKYIKEENWLGYEWNFSITHQFNKKFPLTKFPLNYIHANPLKKNIWDWYVEGKNPKNIKLIDERLEKLLKKHNLTPEGEI